MLMPTSRDCSALCKPRFATPATPGRANLAAGIAQTAVLLGFRTSLGPGLMPWQHEANEVATELGPDGRFVFRQVVIEVMRQQGKSVDLLSMMIARALRRPGTQISYTAQTRLDARHRMLDVWWPRIERSKLRRFIDIRRGSGSEAYLFRNGSMLGLVSGTETSGHGDVVDLPLNATPIDFAYAIHSDIGDHVFAAKVNGKLVHLNEVLHNGDIVEIDTKKSATPKPKWLDFAKTTLAKRHIRNALEKEQKK